MFCGIQFLRSQHCPSIFTGTGLAEQLMRIVTIMYQVHHMFGSCSGCNCVRITVMICLLSLTANWSSSFSFNWMVERYFWFKNIFKLKNVLKVVLDYRNQSGLLWVCINPNVCVGVKLQIRVPCQDDVSLGVWQSLQKFSSGSDPLRFINVFDWFG